MPGDSGRAKGTQDKGRCGRAGAKGTQDQGRCGRAGALRTNRVVGASRSGAPAEYSCEAARGLGRSLWQT
eukprot:6607203-Prymnesium_polylepis.2